MKSGSNRVLLAKLNVNLDYVAKIIFTFKSEHGKIVQRTYPEDVEYSNGNFVIKLYQPDTALLKGYVNIQAQINYTEGAVVFTEIGNTYIEHTLSTETVELDAPGTINSDILEFKVVGDVVVAYINSEVSKEFIDRAVHQYLQDHHDELKGDDGFSPKAKVTQGNNEITIKITDIDGETSATIKGYDHSEEFNRLANQVRTDANTASSKAGSANTSAVNAQNSATSAKASEDNAKTYSSNASASATNASNSASFARTSADNASTSENNARTSADNASASALQAKNDADYVRAKASEIDDSLTEATTLAEEVKVINSGFDSKVSTAIDNIDKKGREVVESIPEDYTNLLNAFNALGFKVVDGKLCVSYESEVND